MFRRTFTRNSGQFEGTAHEIVGFRGQKGQEVEPNFAPNITMEFHYHVFFFPDLSLSLREGACRTQENGIRTEVVTLANHYA